MVDNDGKETVSILEEAFLTKLSDCCEVEIRFAEHFWPLEYYLEDNEYYSIDPIPFSVALVYLDGNSLVIEDDGNFLYGYEGKTKVSIDISKHNLLQAIVGYKDYFYRGFDIRFKKTGVTPSEAERESTWSAERILNEDEDWIEKLELDFKYYRPESIFDKYKKDGYIEFELCGFIIKGEMENFPPFDMNFGCLESSMHNILEVEINEHIRFYVCCDTNFVINDTIEFTIEKKRS